MSDLIERPIDAADPTYPDALRCAQTLEACEDDLLTEAQFVRWQGQEIERLTAERDAFAKEAEENKMRVITCGVAAEHSDANLTRTGAYAKKWDSAQAESVRKLRDERDELRRQLAEAEQDAKRFVTLAKHFHEVLLTVQTIMHGHPGASADLTLDELRHIADLPKFQDGYDAGTGVPWSPPTGASDE